MLTVGLERTDRYSLETVEAYYPVLLKAYGETICEHSWIYPGAMETIEALKAQGYGVGICTNKPEGLADQLLKELRVRDAFDALVGADTLPVRKPDPAPLVETVARLGGEMPHTVLVGDSDTDRNTAKACGCALGPCDLWSKRRGYGGAYARGPDVRLRRAAQDRRAFDRRGVTPLANPRMP